MGLEILFGEIGIKSLGNVTVSYKGLMNIVVTVGKGTKDRLLILCQKN